MKTLSNKISLSFNSISFFNVPLPVINLRFNFQVVKQIRATILNYIKENRKFKKYITNSSSEHIVLLTKYESFQV